VTLGCLAQAFGGAIELRDKELAGHTERVAVLGPALAQRLGSAELGLRYARPRCLLHDIGKMGIPETIPLEPSTLTDDQRRMMQRH
jgi:HD-GYP domain-containing protein (c-di-GMP phosphodiesterase class II)